MSLNTVSLPLDLIYEKLLYENFLKHFEPNNIFSKNEEFDGKTKTISYTSKSKNFVKKVKYNHDTSYQVQHLFNGNLLFCIDYKQEKMVKKTVYDKKGTVKSTTNYEYDNFDRLVNIQRLQNSEDIIIKYAYDDLDRIKSKIILRNYNIIDKQVFIYDFFNRVVEYNDSNKKITVKEFLNEDTLISYEIIDAMNKSIIINNKFNDDKYQYTNITIDSITKCVNDKKYLQNIMLEQPKATEDDLDYVVARIFNENLSLTNKKLEDATDKTIQNNIKTLVLPISMRKHLLYQIASHAV